MLSTNRRCAPSHGPAIPRDGREYAACSTLKRTGAVALLFAVLCASGCAFIAELSGPDESAMPPVTMGQITAHGSVSEGAPEKRSFVLGKDKLFIRMLLHHELAQTKPAACSSLSHRPELRLKVAVNGGEEIQIAYLGRNPPASSLVAKQDLLGTRIPFSVKPDKHVPYAVAMKVAPLLVEGTNQLRLVATAVCLDARRGGKTHRWDLAQGEMAIDVPKRGVAKFYKRIGLRLPKHAYRGGRRLESAMREAVVERYSHADVLGIRTISDDWHIHRGEFNGKPEKRSLVALVVWKGKDDTECKLTDFSFYQNATGRRGKYYKHMDTGVRSLGPFPCIVATL
ncbi:MAG: hypothetical protein ACI9MR_001847 [Myxococcota bacterium]|jgi:hypothetical protein